MKKLMVSLLFCVAGFAGSFATVTIHFPGQGIYLHWYWVFPFMIVLAYGSRYAWIAAFAGALFPLVRLSEAGWESMTGALLLSSLFLVHGWAADRRRDGEKSIRFDAYMIQLYFGLAESALILLSFPLLVDLAASIGLKGGTGRQDAGAAFGLVFSSVLNGFESLIVSDSLLRLPRIRAFMGLPRHEYERLNLPILFSSVAVFLFLWLMFCFLASYLQGSPLSSAFSPEDPHVALFLFIVLGGGLFAGNMSCRFSERRLRLEQILKKNEERLRKALEEKDLLFRELQHRVKNNLSMIESLLSLQAMRSDNPTIKTALSDAKGRVGSLTLIYEQLYRAQDLRTVELKTYIEALVSAIRSAYSHLPHITIETRIDEVHTDLKHAVPLGFILNELLTNTIKHAFPDGREGTVRIDLVKEEDKVLFSVADDGVGIPEAYVDGKEGSLGIVLVRTLADQLQAKLAIARDRGTAVSLKMASKTMEPAEPA